MQIVLPGENIYVKKKERERRRLVNSKVIYWIEFTDQLFRNSLAVNGSEAMQLTLAGHKILTT